MEEKYSLIFDEVILKQLKKAGKNKHIKSILINLLDNLEREGHKIGKLLDPNLFIYELKIKHPPIRLYFKHNVQSNEIYVFEFEIKKNQLGQQKTLDKIKEKTMKIFKNLNLFLSVFSLKRYSFQIQ